VRLWRIAVMLGMWLALAACAANGGNDSDNDQHRGFYGGVTGGWH